MSIPILLLIVAPYAVTATAYLESRRRREAPPRWARSVGAATVLVHLAALVLLGKESRHSPFHTESQALSFLAFSLAGVYVVLEATSRIAAYGGGFHALAALLCAVSVPGLSTQACLIATTPPDRLVTWHVGFALLGTAALLAGGLLGFGYLGAYRRMKSDVLAPPGPDGPSLTGLARLSRDASLASLVLLAPSLVLGAQVSLRADAHGAWTLVELALSAVEFALALAAFVVWWRVPRRGVLAARLAVLATLVAIGGFAIVHPFVTRAGG